MIYAEYVFSAEAVVRKIFQMCIENSDPAQIARKLGEQQIFIPKQLILGVKGIALRT